MLPAQTKNAYAVFSEAGALLNVAVRTDFPVGAVIDVKIGGRILTGEVVDHGPEAGYVEIANVKTGKHHRFFAPAPWHQPIVFHNK